MLYAFIFFFHLDQFWMSKTLNVQKNRILPISTWINFFSFYKVYIYLILIDIVLRGYNALSSAIVDFQFIYPMMVLLICKYEALWHEVSVESLMLRWPSGPDDILFSKLMLLLPTLFLRFVQLFFKLAFSRSELHKTQLLMVLNMWIFP